MSVPAYVLLGNSGPSEIAEVRPPLGENYDLRTKQGKLHKQRLLDEALVLREMGLTFAQVGAALGVAGPWVAINTQLTAPRLGCVDRYVLADWRRAITTGQDPEKLTAKREEDQCKKTRERVEERLLQFGDTWSLDAPIRFHGQELEGTTFGGAALASDDLDPQRQIEQAELYELLGDLDEADIDRMDEDTLERLRDKLREAGYGRRPVMAYERDRLADKRRAAGHPGRGRKGSLSKRQRRKMLREAEQDRKAQRKAA